MSLLEEGHVGKRKAPRGTLLYGIGGIGKSTWASMAESPAFIKTENGLDGIDCRSYPRDGVCKTFAEYMQWIVALYNDGEKYGIKTVVTDSLDWLEKLIWGDVARLRGVQDIASIDFAKGYEYALKQWGQVFEGFDALKTRGLAVINIAHCKTDKQTNPLIAASSHDSYEPRLHKWACDLVKEWHDDVLFAYRKEYTTTTDEGFGRVKTHAIGKDERVVLTTKRPGAYAKNRITGLPEEIPLDYRVYADYLNKHLATAA